MSDEMVRRWCTMFSEGRTNVHDDDRGGRPSLVTAGMQIHLFLHLKRLSAAERFSSDDEMKTAVQHWV
jgi:hypothetical protein